MESARWFFSNIKIAEKCLQNLKPLHKNNLDNESMLQTSFNQEKNSLKLFLWNCLFKAEEKTLKNYIHNFLFLCIHDFAEFLHKWIETICENTTSRCVRIVKKTRFKNLVTLSLSRGGMRLYITLSLLCNIIRVVRGYSTWALFIRLLTAHTVIFNYSLSSW